MESTQTDVIGKKWYKSKWMVLVGILLLPFFIIFLPILPVILVIGLVWLMWSKRIWSKKIRIIITALLVLSGAVVIMAVVTARGTPSFTDLPQKSTQQELVIKGGWVQGNTKVSIFLNNNFLTDVQADDNGNFDFPVTLKDGDNSIYATVSYDGEQKKSSEKIITYTNQENIDAQNKAEADARTIAQEAQQKTDEDARVASQQKFVKVKSFEGNQSGKSEEFSVIGKDIKFVMHCEKGLFLCDAWLNQVGGQRQQIFHSPGSSGDFSDERTFSVGPGTFYIDLGSRDRKYTIDVYQNTSPVSAEDQDTAIKKIKVSAPYRSVTGFKLTDENEVMSDLFYTYNSDSGVYRIEITVHPEITNFKLERQYNLAKVSVTINDVTVQYAFNEGYKSNGVVLTRPYEDVEFTFEVDNKTHIGFVRQTDSREAINRTGIESAMKAFLTALLPSIQGNN